METFLAFTIIGVTTAAIYAVIGSGLVLTYATTGVFNFAQGAIGMMAAFAYWQLHVGWDWPIIPAIAMVVLVIAPLGGLALERLMRGLEGTSETTKLVVSVSLMLGFIGLAQAVWNPNRGRSVPQLFGDRVLDLGVTAVSYHQLTILAVAAGVAVGLRLLLHRTRSGVAMRAVVDDRTLSQLNGTPTVRVQQLSWITGTALAAVGGVLVASTAGLNAVVLSLLIVNAYATAIFGRLRSLPLTFVGALVVGLADGYLQGYLPQSPYLAGLRLASPVIILFIVLLVLPNPRLTSHARTREYFPAPTVKGAIVFCACLLFGGIVLATTLSAPDLVTYGKIFPIAVIGLSLVPLLGFANQVSLCQLSLAGIGAVTYAHVGAGGNPLGLVAAVLVATAVGVLIALPAVRLSGIYLALATAAFAVALDRWIFFLPDFDVAGQHVSIFGSGSLPVDRLELFGVSFASPRSQLLLSAAVLAALTGLVAWVRRNRFGRQLMALRDSEAACATFGMSVVGARLAVFALSAGIAGLGGALYGMQLGSIQPQYFDFTTGLPIFTLVAVAGAGFLSAAISTGIILQAVFPLTSLLVPWYTKWQSLTTASAGVALGREPSGAAPQWRDGFRHLTGDRVVSWATLGAVVAVWLARWAGVYGNWAFVILFIGAILVGAAVAELRAWGRGEKPAWVRSDKVERIAGTPLELVGLSEPWSTARLAEIDAALGLDAVVPADLDAVAGPSRSMPRGESAPEPRTPVATS